MRSLLLAAALLFATPAMATEWIHCGDAEGEASVGVLVGALDFVSISAVTMRVNGQDWASSEAYGPGKPIRPSQAYVGDGQILIDLTDEDHNETLAELRVFTADEGEDYVQGGVLRVPGQGAWVVSCDGP
jgi:hypothetical protein